MAIDAAAASARAGARARQANRRTALAVTLSYALFAALWIAGSDALLALLIEDPALRQIVGAGKGMLYVALTALLLYLLLDTWPAGREPAIASGQPPVTRPRYVVPAFLALALFVPLIAYSIVEVHGRQTEEEAHDMLHGVAALKARQLQNWLAERDGDGRALMRSADFAGNLLRWQERGDLAARDLLQNRLDALQSSIFYEGVVLLDGAGRPLLAAGARREVPADVLVLMPRATADVQRTDLYREAGGELHLDWLVPIGGRGRGSAPAGFVVLHVEADRELFPLIQSWHAPSATAESFLVRRDGDQVVYLNTLRHLPGPPLSHRAPFATSQLPAAMSLRGDPGHLHAGIDYRGVAVLAASQRIDGTPWSLIAKIDRDEVMAPLRKLVSWVSLVALSAIAAVAALVVLFWRQQRRTDQLALQAETAARILALNRQLEQRVAERTADLEGANRELGAFAYAVSHDLKAPLRGIDGYSRLLEETHAAALDDEARGFLANIRQGTLQMQRLIEDLLAYARVERATLERIPIDLRALVTAVVAEFRAAIEETGALVAVEVPAMVVEADRDALIIALRNLIDNALKFSRRAAPPRVTIGGVANAGQVRLWVGDNGVGFDMKHQSRIFEIFNRLHPTSEYPGTGVGLALVRKAVERMHGRVTAESAAGYGATFTIELPVVVLDPGKEPAPA